MITYRIERPVARRRTVRHAVVRQVERAVGVSGRKESREPSRRKILVPQVLPIRCARIRRIELLPLLLLALTALARARHVLRAVPLDDRDEVHEEVRLVLARAGPEVLYLLTQRHI